MKKTAQTKQAEELAAQMMNRQERVERAGSAIAEICKREKVSIQLAALTFTAEGKLMPQIQVVPTE